jgi:hypothetical protein
VAKYAVFTIGQLWSLHSSEGWTRAYPTRAAAMAAATEALANEHEDAELHLQDETGFLVKARIENFLHP